MAVFGIIFVVKNGAKTGSMVFIELLYTINFPFVIMLIVGGKDGTLHVILTI